MVGQGINSTGGRWVRQPFDISAGICNRFELMRLAAETHKDKFVICVNGSLN